MLRRCSGVGVPRPGTALAMTSRRVENAHGGTPIMSPPPSEKARLSSETADDAVIVNPPSGRSRVVKTAAVFLLILIETASNAGSGFCASSCSAARTAAPASSAGSQSGETGDAAIADGCYSLPGRSSAKPSEVWRRERDSNPRYPFGYNGFQDRRHQPLGHPSAVGLVRSYPITEVLRGLRALRDLGVKACE